MLYILYCIYTIVRLNLVENGGFDGKAENSTNFGIRRG